MTVPKIRIRALNRNPVRSEGDFVLYWMIANRRTNSNFCLQHAVDWASKLNKPLVVLEALRVGYQWASDRFHSFLIQGMADNEREFAKKRVAYYPYVEPFPGAGSGLLLELAGRAAIIISDDYPCFFIPRMLQSAATQVPVAFEVIDSNGLLPMRSTENLFARAFDFRRFLQKTLPPHLLNLPSPNPMNRLKIPVLSRIPVDITKKWKPANLDELNHTATGIRDLPIDHSVSQVSMRGGSRAAKRRLRDFVNNKLVQYGSRSQPSLDVSSGLSPGLHFGHISAHQVFAAVASVENWSNESLAEKANGSSHGWWGMNEPSEAFLDELVTWRELGFNRCWLDPNYHAFESLPSWAQNTLFAHARDQREYLYDLDQFESADTHDQLWNAAQRQLVREGRIHNYLRMLWGKKILEWSPTPQDALEVMIELNNKYALDGRDPNSYSGIFWVLGRYDRAWGPERPIYGKIRYMSSANTARKFSVTSYLNKYSVNALSR